MPRRIAGACSVPGCGGRAKQRGRCEAHVLTDADRGYDHSHRQRSKQERATAVANGTLCHLCGEPVRAGQALALDHTIDRMGYRGVVHARCNDLDGAARSGGG